MNPRPWDASVTTVARSPGLSPAAVEIVVTVPTFRRPDQVLDTLASLQRQVTDRPFAVILIENEADLREGAAAAGPLFEAGGLDGLVIVAHERGNCNAYNAGWATALAQFPNFQYLAVIDDDEIAEPDWLETLVSTAGRLDADLVGGPQVPRFERPEWNVFAGHPVFSPPYQTTGIVPALYSSGNLLVSRKVLAAMPQPFLEPMFNFMGGGDSDFLSRASALGFRLAWCAEARIVEAVPARRVEADWIRTRSLRNGVISTLVERRRLAGHPAGRAMVWARSLALLAASPFRAMMRLVRNGTLGSLYPVHVALGRIGAEFGYAHEQDREPEKN